MNASWLRWLPESLSRRLHGRVLLQRVLGSSGWLVGDKIARMLVGIGVSVWVARYLGPGRFGALSYALAFAGLFSPLATMGLNTIVVRELVRRPHDRSGILASALALRLLGGAVAAGLAIAVVASIKSGDREGIALVVILVMTFVPQAADVIEFDYQARMDLRILIVVRSAVFVVCSLLKVVLIVAGYGVVPFAVIFAVESLLGAAALVIQERRRDVPFRFSDRTRLEARRLLRDGWPMIFAGLSVTICMRMDQIMLGAMLDDRSVGVFSAAVRVSEGWYFVPMTVMTAAAPAFTSLHSSSPEEYHRKLLQLVRLLTWGALVVALVTTLFANNIMNLLFGAKYAGASAVLALHAWAGVFVSFGLASSPWLTNKGALQHSLYQTVAGAVVNVAANLTLIPLYGAAGAAMATVLGQSVSGFFFNAVLRETRPLFRMQFKALTGL